MKIITFILMSLALSFSLQAQSESYGELINDSKPASRQKNPTVITSKTLEIDGQSNIATFEGNVLIDDDDLTIHCDKLLIFVEEVPDTSVQTAAGNSKTNTSGKSSDSLSEFSSGSKGSKRQVDRIECIGHVLIIRKRIDENGSQLDDQRAKSEKATYYVQQEKIVLNGKERPVVHHGKNIYSGTELVVYRTSEKITGKDIRLEIPPDADNGPNPFFNNKPAPKAPRTQF